jgi:predicted secreted protein
MEKSRKVIFISHCILNQNVRPEGAERAPGVIKDILQLISEYDIGIVQIPCPQIEAGNKLDRKQRDKASYDTKSYRALCRETAKKILDLVDVYLKEGYSVVGIIGVEHSPICAVYQIKQGTRAVPGKGIFIEEVEAEMKKRRFQVPIVGVSISNVFGALEKLRTLLKYG